MLTRPRNDHVTTAPGHRVSQCTGECRELNGPSNHCLIFLQEDMLFLFTQFPILTPGSILILTLLNVHDGHLAHKGRRPLKVPSSPKNQQLHPAWALPGVLLTMCRMRIQAECRTSDVTTYQKRESLVDRGLDRWQPRMAASPPGRNPSTSPHK